MRTALVDDLPVDLELLRSYLSRWAQEKQVKLSPPALFTSGELFLNAFVPHQFDIVFLDIFMDGINGMETARQLRLLDSVCYLIFTTTSREYAVESYEVNSAYYLVKPYDYLTFCQAMNRCGRMLQKQEQYIPVPDKFMEEQRLYLHQIVYTEYERRQVCVHKTDGQTLYIPISQAAFSALLLEHPGFCDCMRGILVNFEAVDKLMKDRFILKNGDTVPISRLKYQEVRRQFLDYFYQRTRGGQ